MVPTSAPMVFVHLTWEASAFFCASLLLSAFFLGGMINPALKYGDSRPLCLVCPEAGRDEEHRRGDMFFANGAAFIYHIICFMHFGGMAAGLLGLVLSLIGAAVSTSARTAVWLKWCFALPVPIAWVAAWAAQLIWLAAHEGWLPYDTTKVDGRGHKYVPDSVALWWVIFATLVASVVALIVVSAYGLVNDTYVVHASNDVSI